MVVDLSKVTIRGQLSRVGKGQWCGGRPPYGYDLIYFDSLGRPYQTIRFLDSGEREVRMTGGTVQRVIPRGDPLPVTSCDRANLIPGDAAKIAVVKLIFDLYVNNGLGLSTIAERLNADGVVSAMGCRPGTRWKGTWSAGTIRALIRNPAYRGATAWNRISYAKFHVVKNGQAVPRSKVAFGRVRRNHETDWMVIEDTHEPLVPPAVFERAQRLIKMKAAAYERMVGPNRQVSPYLLSGLVQCSRCGTRWQGYRVHKGRKRPGEKRIETLYYCCGGYVTKGNSVCERALVGKADLERIVIDVARAHLDGIVAKGRDGVLASIALGGEACQGRPDHEIMSEIAARRKRVEELIDSLTPDMKSVIAPKIRQLRSEIAELEAERQGHRTSGSSGTMQARAASILAWANQARASLRAPLDTMDPASTRGRLRALVKGILLDPDTMTCRISFRAIVDLENDPTIAA
jgi:hypothetical protein